MDPSLRRGGCGEGGDEGVIRVRRSGSLGGVQNLGRELGADDGVLSRRARPSPSFAERLDSCGVSSGRRPASFTFGGDGAATLTLLSGESVMFIVAPDRVTDTGVAGPGDEESDPGAVLSAAAFRAAAASIDALAHAGARDVPDCTAESQRRSRAEPGERPGINGEAGGGGFAVVAAFAFAGAAAFSAAAAAAAAAMTTAGASRALASPPLVPRRSFARR